MLGERELQNRCALHLSVFKNTGAIRGSERESVPLHHASRHRWIDIIGYQPANVSFMITTARFDNTNRFSTAFTLVRLTFRVSMFDFWVILSPVVLVIDRLVCASQATFMSDVTWTRSSTLLN
jgi:hypothetical protein